jgi:hypothetical protein
VNHLCPSGLDACKKVERDDSVQHPPDGIPILTQIECRGKFTLLDTVFEYLFDNVDGLIGSFDDVIVEILGQIHVGGMKHKGHQNSEQFPIIQKKIHIDVRQPGERLRRAGGSLKNIGNVVVKLVDIVQKNLGINLFLAVVIEINGAFAQLRLPGYALDRDRFETLLKKESPGSLQDGVLPVLTFPFSSFFESQDLSPF